MAIPDAELDRTLEAIAAGTIEIGPTVRALMETLGLSSESVVSYRLQQLIERRLVERVGGTALGARGYRLTAAGRARLLVSPLKWPQ